MLVMTRKRDESILVGRDIEIVVVDIRGDKVRLGINAPRELPVHRREVFESIYEAVETSPSSSPRETKPASGGPDSGAASAIGLPGSQFALLDRVRETIGAQSGAAPSREQIVIAILSAVREAQEAFGEPATLEQLKSSIVAAIKGSAAHE
jgi:carbon storage regulator